MERPEEILMSEAKFKKQMIWDWMAIFCDKFGVNNDEV